MNTNYYMCKGTTKLAMKRKCVQICRFYIVPLWYLQNILVNEYFPGYDILVGTYMELELGHLIRCVRHFRNFKTSRNNSLDIFCSFLRYSHLCLNTHFNPNKCITVNALSTFDLAGRPSVSPSVRPRYVVSTAFHCKCK